MSETEITMAAYEAGTKRDIQSVVMLCQSHGFVVQSAKSPRNAGRVPVPSIMRAYADGIRSTLA